MKKQTVRGTMAGRRECPAFFEPWMEFRAAIVRKAADDYIDVMRKMWQPGISVEKKRVLLKEKMELERFFYSRWYDCLCDFPAKKLIQGCIARAEEMEKEAIERKNKQEVKKLLKAAV